MKQDEEEGGRRRQETRGDLAPRLFLHVSRDVKPKHFNHTQKARRPTDFVFFRNVKPKDEEENALHYEWAQRLVRDRHLRDEWLDVLLAEQGGKCTQSVVTCEVVEDGQATNVCPLGVRPVHRDAAQVDHITPLSEGGSNNKPNLQVICAYCHALKTCAEARARAAARRLGQPA